MTHTHLSQSKSRRGLAASLRGSRTRKHARLHHRRLQAERLEDRQLLATINSTASNLVSGDTNGLGDVFVYDRDGGTTERVSVAGGGTQANSWSSSPSIRADGRYVGFFSDLGA